MLKSLFFLSTYFLSSLALAHWSVHSVQGSVNLKKGHQLTAEQKVSAPAGSAVIFKQGPELWTLNFSAPTVVHMAPFSEGLLVHLVSGDFQLKSTGKNQNPFSVEFAGWRFSKNKGQVKVKMSGDGARVTNVTEPLWIKKSDLSDAPQEIASATSFQLRPDQEIFGFESFANLAVPAQWSWGATRRPSSQSAKSSSLCAAPKGQFEQCAWKCMGQKNSRATRCDTGYAQVHCVRMTCTADGQWKWATLVPGGECEPHTIRVDQCQ